MNHTPEELREMVQKMRAASDQFYRSAIQTGCHPFIEFCGMMSKYIDICERSMKSGVDFTESSIHSGLPLAVEGHDIDYLAEKFACIFSATLDSKRGGWDRWDRFIAAARSEPPT